MDTETYHVEHSFDYGYDEEGNRILADGFDYSNLDKPEDFIIEAVQHNPTEAARVIRDIIRKLALRQAVDRLSLFAAAIIDAKNPRVVAHQYIWGTGMDLLENMGLQQIAKLHGVSKQAFQQGAERLCKRLNLPKTGAMRSEKGRENMRLRNSRR